MDEGNKCATLMRSDCTLETLLSESNNYSANCQSSSSIKTPEIDLASSNDAFLESEEITNSTGYISKRLRKLVHNLDKDFWKLKSHSQPPSPYLSINENELFNADALSVSKKLHDVQKNSSQDLLKDSIVYDSFRTTANPTTTFVIEPQNISYVLWLCLVTIAYLYNCFVIPLRITFPYQTEENTSMWLIWDYSMDLFYLLDIVLVKPRVMYLEDGFWVRNPKLMRKNYFQKVQFKMDVLSLLPLDLLYFVFGAHNAIFRVPRLLKVRNRCGIDSRERFLLANEREAFLQLKIVSSDLELKKVNCQNERRILYM